MHYWLLKSEFTYSIDNLQSEPEQTGVWDGVRNYQARNFLRDSMTIGDLGFFYHSNCKVPGIVGTIKIVSNSYPDPSAFNAESAYFDAKSTTENPRWFVRDIQLVTKFADIITLSQIRSNPELQDMLILRKGSRLSVTPVTSKQWEIINQLAAR